MLNKEQLLSAFPKDSPPFDRAVNQALLQIHDQASRRAHKTFQTRRALIFTLAAALLLISAFGVAEGLRRGVFDFLIGGRSVRPDASALIQQDLPEKRVGRTILRVNEVVYDGAAIRFVLSVRNEAIKRPLTENEPYGFGEMGEALAADGVTALCGFDRFAIDGVWHSMTSGSGGENAAGEEDGEALVFFELQLTESEGQKIPAPTADFTLTLPICAAEPWSIPIRYIASNLLRDVTPKSPSTLYANGSAYTVTVTQARLSPIKNVVELRLDVPDTVDRETALACLAPWYTIALVDENGVEIGKSSLNTWGLPVGETDDTHHLFLRIEATPVDSWPSGLFVAPLGAGTASAADMRLAIALNAQ